MQVSSRRCGQSTKHWMNFCLWQDCVPCREWHSLYQRNFAWLLIKVWLLSLKHLNVNSDKAFVFIPSFCSSTSFFMATKGQVWVVCLWHHLDMLEPLAPAVRNCHVRKFAYALSVIYRAAWICISRMYGSLCPCVHTWHIAVKIQVYESKEKIVAQLWFWLCLSNDHRSKLC